MRKKYAVIGLGHFGLNLSLELMERGAEVLAVDIEPNRVEMVRDRVSHAMIVDSSEMSALEELGLHEFDAVVVAIGEDFESSVLTTAHLQELGVKRIVNRVVSTVHEKLLKLMSVDELILPESEAAGQLAIRLTRRGVIECLELTDQYSIVEVEVPRRFIGKTLNEVDLRNSYQLNLVTVIRKTKHTGFITKGQRPEREVYGIPQADYIFEEDDILVLFGQEKDLARLQ